MSKRLRAFAYQMPDGIWVAHCVDLSLAAQGDSYGEVRRKLHDQVVDYCKYVNSIDDAEFRRQLMRRPAPLGTRAFYWVALLGHHLGMRVKPSAPVPPKSWIEKSLPQSC
ncbi:hypothetical protein [Arenimonas caeni]|nr:hypothetical protein [Arenimonas caeni]